MSIIFIDLLNSHRRSEEFGGRFLVFCPHHSVPGNAFEGFSFIGYSRFVNRPVTMETIQHSIDPSSFLFGLTQGAHPGWYTRVIRVGNCLSPAPSKGQTRQCDGGSRWESKLATCRL